MTDRTDIVTSFSSKSELALNLSTSGSALTFMGYKALINTLDVSIQYALYVADEGDGVNTTAR